MKFARLLTMLMLCGVLAIVVVVRLPGDTANPASYQATPPPDLHITASPVLFCRTKHTQDYRATGNSPDYDITCWSLVTPSPSPTMKVLRP